MQDARLLNIDKICSMLMLDEDSVKSLLKKFEAMLPEMVDEIRGAVDSGNIILVNGLGHKLKGTAGNFRIEELQEISDDINKLKACEDEAACLVGKLENCVNRLIVEINESC